MNTTQQYQLRSFLIILNLLHVFSYTPCITTTLASSADTNLLCNMYILPSTTLLIQDPNNVALTRFTNTNHVCRIYTLPTISIPTTRQKDPSTISAAADSPRQLINNATRQGPPHRSSPLQVSTSNPNPPNGVLCGAYRHQHTNLREYRACRHNTELNQVCIPNHKPPDSSFGVLYRENQVVTRTKAIQTEAKKWANIKGKHHLQEDSHHTIRGASGQTGWRKNVHQQTREASICIESEYTTIQTSYPQPKMQHEEQDKQARNPVVLNENTPKTRREDYFKQLQAAPHDSSPTNQQCEDTRSRKGQLSKDKDEFAAEAETTEESLRRPNTCIWPPTPKRIKRQKEKSGDSVNNHRPSTAPSNNRNKTNPTPKIQGHMHRQLTANCWICQSYVLNAPPCPTDPGVFYQYTRSAPKATEGTCNGKTHRHKNITHLHNYKPPHYPRSSHLLSFAPPHSLWILLGHSAPHENSENHQQGIAHSHPLSASSLPLSTLNSTNSSLLLSFLAPQDSPEPSTLELINPPQHLRRDMFPANSLSRKSRTIAQKKSENHQQGIAHSLAHSAPQEEAEKKQQSSTLPILILIDSSLILPVFAPQGNPEPSILVSVNPPQHLLTENRLPAYNLSRKNRTIAQVVEGGQDKERRQGAQAATKTKQQTRNNLHHQPCSQRRGSSRPRFHPQERRPKQSTLRAEATRPAISMADAALRNCFGSEEDMEIETPVQSLKKLLATKQKDKSNSKRPRDKNPQSATKTTTQCPPRNHSQHRTCQECSQKTVVWLRGNGKIRSRKW